MKTATHYTLFTFFLLICQNYIILSQTAITPSYGNGTPENPYEIHSIENLYWLSQNPDFWEAYFVQKADIDASESCNWDEGQGFMPIGNDEIKFTGLYNGSGYVIDKLFINRPMERYVGMFGVTLNGSICELGLTNLKVRGNSFVGGLVGNNGSCISACFTTGMVLGMENPDYTGTAVGGLVGINGHFLYGSPFIKKSYSTCTVKGDKNIGGLIGMNVGHVFNSYSMGNVSGNNVVGGFVGCINNVYGSVCILNCYSIGSCEGDCSGGFCGHLRNRNEIPVIIIAWDKETSESLYFSGELEEGNGRSTEEMKNVKTFTFNIDHGFEWDFIGNPYNDKRNEDIWNIDPNINNGYPYLVELLPVLNTPIKYCKFQIYPIPASHEITMKFPDELISETMRIYDGDMNLIELREIQENEEKMDVSNLEAGVYYLQIKMKNKVWQAQSVIVH